MDTVNSRISRKNLKYANAFSIIAVALFGIVYGLEYASLGDYPSMVSTWSFTLLAILLMALVFHYAKNIFFVSFCSPLFVFLVYVAYSVFEGNFDSYFLVFLALTILSGAYFHRFALILFILCAHLVTLFLFLLGVFLPAAGVKNGQDLAAKWIIALSGSLFYLAVMFISSKEREQAAHGDERFRTMLANTPNMTAIVDGLYRVVYVSKAMAEFARIRDPELCAGQSVFDLFDEMDIKMMLGDAFDSPGLYQDTRKIEVNGENRHFKIIAERFSSGVEGTFIDITDITSEVQSRIEAETANRTKSDFLASMSHEIRTPMNAVVGMAELLLRGNLDEDERGYANDIKQAGNNLISIINDILDFSKIESGKMEIVPVNYLLSSLVNDVVSIIRMRLVDRPIRFYTNVDAYLPNGMKGDEVRLRQILLNLLSNAAKYTERGCISMSIVVEKQEEDTVWLKMSISDTGIGIKPEDRQKLFGDFIRVDTKKNQGIEGTGLGLAITKRLCTAMGGSISVESKYGEGSTFTVIIPQGINSRSPFAAVEEPKKKKVLVYEGRLYYARSVCWSLYNMHVPHVMVENEKDFAKALFQEEWYFVFSGYGLYDKIKPLMDRDESAFSGGKKPPLALMVEWGTEAYIPGVRFVALPVQGLSIANVLNGRPDRGYMEASGGLVQTRFIIPEERLLIVDDIATNLKVAEGLLTPYQAVVDTCLSGPEAIELVKRYHYDIVFMDHMMPGMDGVEATELIRKWESSQGLQQVPIIALTANAVSGMKEMFLSKGFNDFLAKPIDVSKLDEALTRWIPRAMQKKSDIATPLRPAIKKADLHIPGVDVQRGIASTGGTINGYRQVLSTFRKDAKERLAFLRDFCAKTSFEYTGENLSAFTTQVHALKSASASLGAAEVSAEAARLEAAGKAEDMTVIKETLPGFMERLAALTEGIGAVLTGEIENGKGIIENGKSDILNVQLSIFNSLASALEARDFENIDRLLAELEQSGLDAKTAEKAAAISDAVLMAEYDKAITLINRQA
jgi:signal transduction histidine kinase/DNA-binding NarL/FixJ family response regulator/HPt (histidine-containing phosphotransfer) domain-containing protein